MGVIMEEKERYEMNGKDCLVDNEQNTTICDFCELTLFPEIIINLLNEQDKRIKELELLLKADKKIETNSLNGFEKLRKENQQLKKKLEEKELDIPKLLQVSISKEEIEKLNLLLKQNPMCISIDTTQPTIELMDANKKAIEELRRIKENILINDKYDEEAGCNIIETFDLLEDIRDRIEKLGGGENE